MGDERLGWLRASGVTEHELAVLFAVAELDGQQPAADELGLSLRTVKNHLNRLSNRLGNRSALTTYHRLVRGVRFETTVTTKLVLEDD